MKIIRTNYILHILKIRNVTLAKLDQVPYKEKKFYQCNNVIFNKNQNNQ